MSLTIPISLYIHIPWCVKKCPYCDFNSHAVKQQTPEKQYIQRLLTDLQENQHKLQQRSIDTIFIGGGTPSLFSAESVELLLTEIKKNIPLANDIEITMEANPGTAEQQKFIGFRQAGVNRLSLGIQSLQNDKLKQLGRIHDRDNAINAVLMAKQAGFDNFNCDLMFALPSQTIDDALNDLTELITLQPPHISWYQLTLEPNTYFYHHPPTLPKDDTIFTMQQQGQELLANHYYQQYEISAYSKPDHQCQHNINYWQFGDYLGIGAGAHSKITNLQTGTITREWKAKHPKDYLNTDKPLIAGTKQLNPKEIPLEFMMNALRLYQPTTFQQFSQRTNLPRHKLSDSFAKAVNLNLIINNDMQFSTTPNGKLFLNNLLELFS